MLWSPFEASNISNPYPMYARLRNEDQVHLAQTGEFIISGYDNIRSILKSPSFRSGNRLEWLARGIQYFKNHDEDLTNIYKAISSFVLFLNPPDHAAIRGFVMKTWDDRNVQSIIDEVVDDCLKSLPKEFDLVKDLAQPIPARVTCSIMGIPMEDHEYLRRLGVTLVRSLDLFHSWKDLVELNETASTFLKYFSDLIRRNPGGLLGKLIKANERQKILNEQQMISIGIFLFIAGEETTANSISRSLYHIISNSDIYQQLKRDPSLIQNTATDEFFRFDGPVHLLGRITKEDVVVNNKTIPANSPITLILSSANRDESQFQNADEIDIRRSPNNHLAFGYGTHFCMGEWLGKLQVNTALERFLAKFNSATIPAQEIKWLKNIAVRGMTSLTVNVNE